MLMKYIREEDSFREALLQLDDVFLYVDQILHLDVHADMPEGEGEVNLDDVTKKLECGSQAAYRVSQAVRPFTAGGCAAVFVGAMAPRRIVAHGIHLGSGHPSGCPCVW
mmetsp:Transcript_5127/g.16580  ORF Transcript_5127/g.16580 Transcript_5127/m.16580 type:complete len:109 (-) Transcript_5127:8-334(-)